MSESNGKATAIHIYAPDGGPEPAPTPPGPPADPPSWDGLVKLLWSYKAWLLAVLVWFAMMSLNALAARWFGPEAVPPQPPTFLVQADPSSPGEVRVTQVRPE